MSDQQKASETKQDLSHITVLRDETVDALRIRRGGTYVDCTLGGGGHSEKICQALDGEGALIGIDQDAFALFKAEARLAEYTCQKLFIHDSFFNLKQILLDNAPDGADGICFDLGVSSFQFDDPERGFSYHHDGPLDMRMDQSAALTAEIVVNTYDKADLVRVLRDYGEEHYAARIAERIIAERAQAPIRTTLQLAELIRLAYPGKMRYKEKHPARKSFQAIRIEVNHELDELSGALQAAVDALNPGGRLAVITFHSLEDRIVKQFFKAQSDPCTCPPDFPVCVCGKKPVIRSVNRKPMSPDGNEIEKNRRSRSAKLRIVEKLPSDGERKDEN